MKTANAKIVALFNMLCAALFDRAAFHAANAMQYARQIDANKAANVVDTALEKLYKIQCDNVVDFAETYMSKLKIEHVALLSECKIDITTLARCIANADQKRTAKNDYVAKYAVEKIIKFCDAIVDANVLKLDNYSMSIVLNMHKLQSAEKQALSAKSALACLSKSITYNDNELAQSIRRFSNCVATTASTQRSSTRETLRMLQIASVTKDKRDDALTFTDSEFATRMRALAAATLQAYTRTAASNEATAQA